MPRKKTAKSTDNSLAIRPPQAGLFDSELTNETVYRLIKERAELHESYRAYGKKQRELRAAWQLLCAEFEVTDGDRIQISDGEEDSIPYIVEAKSRAGGGHNVPEWKSMGIGTITTAVAE